MATKICRVPVQARDLVAAQGGRGGGAEWLHVEMPTDYNPGLVTAEDLLHDPALRVVPDTET